MQAHPLSGQLALALEFAFNLGEGAWWGQGEEVGAEGFNVYLGHIHVRFFIACEGMVASGAVTLHLFVVTQYVDFGEMTTGVTLPLYGLDCNI